MKKDIVCYKYDFDGVLIHKYKIHLYQKEFKDHKFNVEERFYIESYTLDDERISSSIRNYYALFKRKEVIKWAS